ncbi:transmembrane protein 40 [Aegotheles albertisi]
MHVGGTAMESVDVPFPDLSEEQQDLFQRVFTADANYLENHEKMNQSFWESLVKCLATTDPPVLSTEEKNNLLNSCDVLPGGCATCLKAIEKKGVRAMAVLYLLLKTTNPSAYRQLPSSKGKAYEKEIPHPQQWAVRWMGIRKDDEFFHFVILCFAIGALLICFYYYKDWTISLGTGLITFASLETTGIYFGLGKNLQQPALYQH